ncbi:MAG: hypothetical protein CM1200mP2_38380 [Planctomycetaceae bacterium]|nr:MAG: hypothetical protein CM1200mP2_38380 [Planctomycetaceae bacterium]
MPGRPKVDVTDAEQVAAVVAKCMDHWGRVDILHNNVGILDVGGPVDASLESWERVVSVNLTSMFLTCKYVLPVMEAQGGGAHRQHRLDCRDPLPGDPLCVLLRHQGRVLQLTQSVALEYAEKGVRVNSILPGLMNTPMIVEPLKGVYADGDVDKMIEMRNEQVPMKTMGMPGTLPTPRFSLGLRRGPLHHGHPTGRRWRIDVQVLNRECH